MTPPRNENGSIHGMSMAVGKLQGEVGALREAIEHLNSNFKMKDNEAQRQREHLHGKFDDLRSDVREVKSNVESVQQDVAEMKNDMAVAQDKLDAIEQHKTVVMGAIGDVDELKQFRLSLEKKEQRALGWWDILSGLGLVGWTAIGAIGTGALGLLFYWLQRRFL